MLAIALAAAADAAAIDALPQIYASEAQACGDGGSLLATILAAGSEQWGGDGFLIDIQVAELRPGMHPGLPVWCPVPGPGEALLGCLAAEPLLEVATDDGHPLPVPGHQLVRLAPGTRVRFRSPTQGLTAAVVMLTPRAGRQALNRPRHSARVFAPRPNPTTPLWPSWAARDDLVFTSGWEERDPLPRFSAPDIADEPLFGGASYADARRSGGPIMQAWLDCMPPDWRADPDLIITVKRDELSPGWWPALLAWHLDGTSRCHRRADGTPDLRHPGRMARQFAACVGGTSPTGLLRGVLRLPEIPLGAPAPLGQGVWAHRIAEQLAAGQVEARTAPCDRAFAFGWGGFHACSRSLRPGWRLFIKAMRGRGDVPTLRPLRRGTVAWPSDGPDWPSDPLGIFPRELP